MLVQKMAVNADLGFLLALVAFLSSGQSTPQLEVYVYIEQNCKTSYVIATSVITHTIILSLDVFSLRIYMYAQCNAYLLHTYTPGV